MRLLPIFIISSLSVLSVNAFSCDFQSGSSCGYFKNLPKLMDKSWTPGVTKTVTLDHSTDWHRCESNQTGGSCGTRTLTTGDNKCTTHSQQVGFDFELGDMMPGVKFKTGYSTAWTVCNSRAEAITCGPSKGYMGRAEVRLDLATGVKEYINEELSIYTPAAGNRCPLGGTFRPTRGGTGQCFGATKSGTKTGEWPKERFSQCIYRKI